MKPTAIIFGMGATGQKILPTVQQKFEVIGYTDNNPKLTSSESGFPVYSPAQLPSLNFDEIIIGSVPGIATIPKQLIEMGIDRHKINTDYVEDTNKPRLAFLRNLAEIFGENQIIGNVAEGGVLQGDFAKEINALFPQKTLYLFDTFAGFDERDISVELKMQYSEKSAGYYNITTEELVLSKMPHPENVVIKKGYFPETAAGLENEQFCFVNLDFDLYNPILAGLEFFAPRMVTDGVILVHDYFNDVFRGAKQAVTEFANAANKQYFPIGDGLSVGFMF
ncbi:MAG: TylF/MycF family methyltransferase [Defluviitaleaceae bacterium]|nr:TylF/MycF family methyltransferase [Defluviitaleaceae bacterium]